MHEPGVDARVAVNEALLRAANERFRRLFESSDALEDNEVACVCGALDCSERSA